MRLYLEKLEAREAAYSLVAPWPVMDLTYSFVDNTDEQTRKVIERAFRLWDEVSPLSFREGPADSMIRISFNRDLPPDRVAQAGYPGDSPSAGDISFNREISRAAPTRLFRVALHEIGHAIGLAHSSVPGAIMFPVETTYPDRLTPDDIDGVHALYGPGPNTGQRPVNPPEPFPGFAGFVSTVRDDIDRDGVLDVIFAADSAQGHIKVLDGENYYERLSILAFPGFYGHIELSSSPTGIRVVAATEDFRHVKIFSPDGSEISSFMER